MEHYAHSLPEKPEADWELLSHHLSAVGGSAARFAAVFGWGTAAQIAGWLHDIGKAAAQFQIYIRVSSTGSAEPIRGGDHSTAGARTAVAHYSKDDFGRLLAFGIAGHHAGLGDAEDLDRRLDPKRTVLPDYEGWEAHTEPLPDLSELTPKTSWKRGAHKGFSQAFLVRMLFSCLVDADFLETERFYSTAKGAMRRRGQHQTVAQLLDRLRAHQAGWEPDTTALNQLRAEVLAHATAKAALPPGLFTLTVPTGGGKTLTSLRFALEHAAQRGLRRIVYVVPYTSIIEQTADVFRRVLATVDDVLEHHASFDWEAAGRSLTDDGDGRDGLAQLRRDAENWDAPVIVTTAVQFFESLYAARGSRCRKLHNLARSVIVLDEAQTLPLPLLQPCLAAVDELRLNYGASVVLCTATQPAVRVQDGFKVGLDIPPERELAPNPPGLYARLRRVQVERMSGVIDDTALANRFAACSQMLCIVNRRSHAAALFGRIRGQKGAAHLTTLMCPRHRRAVLARVRRHLQDKVPVRLVATSLIEAGVDIDFPEVWRAIAGLDSVAQAAGRCNREGGMAGLGRVVVFKPAEHKPLRTLTLLVQTAEGVLDRFDDPLTPEAMTAYFSQLYWTRGEVAFDAALLDGKVFPILQEIAEASRGFRYPFAKIAAAFRMIDDALDPVIVPWRGEDGTDTHATDLLARIASTPRPRTEDLRMLQQYTVPVPPAARELWLRAGALRPVHKALGSALLAFTDDAHYDSATGLRLDDPTQRSPASNQF